MIRISGAATADGPLIDRITDFGRQVEARARLREDLVTDPSRRTVRSDLPVHPDVPGKVFDRRPQDAARDVRLPLGAVHAALIAGPRRHPADSHGPFAGHRGRLAEQAVAIDAFGARGERDESGAGEDPAHGNVTGRAGLSVQRERSLPREAARRQPPAD